MLSRTEFKEGKYQLSYIEFKDANGDVVFKMSKNEIVISYLHHKKQMLEALMVYGALAQLMDYVRHRVWDVARMPNSMNEKLPSPLKEDIDPICDQLEHHLHPLASNIGYAIMLEREALNSLYPDYIPDFDVAEKQSRDYIEDVKKKIDGKEWHLNDEKDDYIVQSREYKDAVYVPRIAKMGVSLAVLKSFLSCQEGFWGPYYFASPRYWLMNCYVVDNNEELTFVAEDIGKMEKRFPCRGGVERIIRHCGLRPNVIRKGGRGSGFGPGVKFGSGYGFVQDVRYNFDALVNKVVNERGK